eukprot:2847080-Rhodomonas_salina.1
MEAQHRDTRPRVASALGDWGEDLGAELQRQRVFRGHLGISRPKRGSPSQIQRERLGRRERGSGR